MPKKHRETWQSSARRYKSRKLTTYSSRNTSEGTHGNLRVAVARLRTPVKVYGFTLEAQAPAVHALLIAKARGAGLARFYYRHRSSNPRAQLVLAGTIITHDGQAIEDGTMPTHVQDASLDFDDFASQAIEDVFVALKKKRRYISLFSIEEIELRMYLGR